MIGYTKDFFNGCQRSIVDSEMLVMWHAFPSGKSEGKKLTHYMLLDARCGLYTDFQVTNWHLCFHFCDHYFQRFR